MSRRAAVRSLKSVPIHIVDLPGISIGFTDMRTGEIWIDRDAAGYGWFVDNSPATDGESSLRLNRSARLAVDGPADDRYDLLTVLTHEFGHLLGLPSHAHNAAAKSELMNTTLGLATRRTPSKLDIAAARTHLRGLPTPNLREQTPTRISLFSPLPESWIGGGSKVVPGQVSQYEERPNPVERRAINFSFPQTGSIEKRPNLESEPDSKLNGDSAEKATWDAME